MPDQLIHYIRRPDCLKPNVNEPLSKQLIKKVPIKKDSIPEPCSTNPIIDGWGIYFKEEPNWSSIIIYAGVCLSLIIAVLWSKLTGDPQTGFTISGWFVAVIVALKASYGNEIRRH